MKVTKLTKLLISFMGGGKIDFPTRHLRDVEIEGDGLDGGGGGEDSDSLVDFAVSFYNENKNGGNFAILFPSLEEYNQDYKEYVSKEYGNGNNIVYIRTADDEEVVFKFTDDEFTEFMYKTAIFSDWRNNYKSFPINNVIDIDNDGKQFIQVYNSNLLGNFGGAILGYRAGIALGLTGKENFIKLNSIVDAGNMFFRNDSWIYTRTQQFNLNNYNFNQIFDSTFDIYKLKCGDLINNAEFGLIKIINKNNDTDILFTTYDTNTGGSD